MKALWRVTNKHHLPALGIFLVICLLGVFLAGQTNFLECTRTPPRGPVCSLRTTWMDIVPLRVVPVNGLRGAYVQEQCDDDGCTYRVAMDTTAGRRPLTSAYSSGTKRKYQAVDQINRFIKDSSQTELVVEGGGKAWILIPAPFLFIATYLFLCSLIEAIKEFANAP